MSEHIRAAFIRQRRNLMVVSLALIFVEFAELTVTKVSLFGNELTVSNPMAVNSALWIGYFYWLWRYYVYFHDLGDKGFLSTYQRQMLELVKRCAFRQLQKDSQFIKLPQSHMAEPGELSWSFRSPFRYVVNLRVNFMPPTGQIFAQPESLSYTGIEVTARVPLLIAHSRAWVHVFTRTHLPSEYVLPYLVAAAPLVYIAIRKLTYITM